MRKDIVEDGIRTPICDACEIIVINGLACHEHGCPEAWRDYDAPCLWCGTMFHPEEQGQRFCDESCAESYST